MLGDSPLVSIVIPMYNAERYILETIESVIAQTYKKWELLVVDDCSTDNSRSLVKGMSEKDSRIKLINSDFSFGGPAKPRNIGIEHSQGKYIAFLDSDDIWLEDKLDIQIIIMEKQGYNFTSTNILNVDESLHSMHKSYLLSRFLRKFSRKNSSCDLMKNSFIATSSVIVEKKVMSDFSEEKDSISVEDLCLWLTLFNREDIKYKYIQKKLLKYRVLDTSISARGIKYKQETKANLCILKFILNNNKFDTIGCYYAYSFKLIVMFSLKSLFRYRPFSKIKG